MFGWLKKLFGSSAPSVEVVEQAVVEAPKEKVQSHVSKVVKVEQAEAPAKPKKQAKKPAAKPKASKVKAADLDSMNKKQLLEEAKKRGVKANASLKKEEILERIKAG